MPFLWDRPPKLLINLEPYLLGVFGNFYFVSLSILTVKSEILTDSNTTCLGVQQTFILSLVPPSKPVFTGFECDSQSARLHQVHPSMLLLIAPNSSYTHSLETATAVSTGVDRGVLFSPTRRLFLHGCFVSITSP